MKYKELYFFLLASLFFCSCQTVSEKPAQVQPVEVTNARVSHENLNGLLWMQTSAEFDSLCRMIYKSASYAATEALLNPEWTASIEQAISGTWIGLPPAVILDLDETVMDNTPYQALMAKMGKMFDGKSWDEWVAKGSAGALPGAAEFLREMQKKSIAVFYITNREVAREKEMIANLILLGIPVDPDGANILCRNEQPEWKSDKSSRRAEVAKTHRIILLVGDDLGDFVSGARDLPEKRIALARLHADMWGSRWFILPNPLYGSWESAVFGFDGKLKDDEILKKKFEALKTSE
jgi:5'-nucleotidase (lipoprotein e(P4) family)